MYFSDSLYLCWYSLTKFSYSFYFLKNSVNGRESRIPYPWLVFNEKVKVNSVFLRDSTGVSDSVLLLFGGNISRGPLVCFFFCFKLLSIIWQDIPVGAVLVPH